MEFTLTNLIIWLLGLVVPALLTAVLKSISLLRGRIDSAFTQSQTNEFMIKGVKEDIKGLSDDVRKELSDLTKRVLEHEKELNAIKIKLEVQRAVHNKVHKRERINTDDE